MAKRTGSKRGQQMKVASQGGINKHKGNGKGASFNPGNASTNPDRKTKKGGSMRTKATINRLNMYTEKPDEKKRKQQALAPMRIQPDRRWFGNTRVITQDKMQKFREEIGKSVDDPFSVVLKASKLPMGLLTEGTSKDTSKARRANLLTVEPYQETFGAKSTRKRPRRLISSGEATLEAMMEQAQKKAENYDESKDQDCQKLKAEEEVNEGKDLVSEGIFKKGTSRRIWGELYKVVDSSDVLLQVIDARDPMGTRCMKLEREIRRTRPNKHIVLILNKCDLIPTWATRRWVQVLSKEFPTLAFHASVTNPFGKSSLLQLLRQFSSMLLKDRKHVQVGFIGYPNVGKSSVINALKKKKVCRAAPVPGETKVWQYISLTKQLYLIDCPGIVPPSSSDFKNDASKVLRGVVRAERLESPSEYVGEVLGRVKTNYLKARYGLSDEISWKDSEEFLQILARKQGKLKKGGEPDIEIAARVVLYDWQRGKIPFFELPPKVEEEKGEEEEKEGEKEEVKIDQTFDDLTCVVDYTEGEKEEK